MNQKSLAEVTVRTATIRDIDGILALKERIRGISLPWREEELKSQITLFPEGQFVALSGDSRKIIGALGTLIISRFNYPLITKWGDLTDHGTFRNHDPVHGKTLFRSHLIVDSELDCRWMRDLLSRAELEVALKLNLERIRAGVRFKDYYLFRHLAPGEYFREVRQGLINDSWISQTLGRGFKALALVTGYYPKDWRSEGYAVVAQLELHPPEIPRATGSRTNDIPHLDLERSIGSVA